MCVMEDNLRTLMWCPGETPPKLGCLDLTGRLQADISQSAIEGERRRPLNSVPYFLYACLGSCVFPMHLLSQDEDDSFCPSCFLLCQRDLLPFSPITFHSSNKLLLHNNLLLHAFALMSPLPGMLFSLNNLKLTFEYSPQITSPLGSLP